uniref:Ion_trans domain-containing protein n=1 Tax=Haemonchus placei TaxID=6290 RepID=A0A0N4VUT4_HAEPC
LWHIFDILLATANLITKQGLFRYSCILSRCSRYARLSIYG